MKVSAVTTVIDAGARYGMHPTWSAFEGELNYFAFEPDAQEADRLRVTAARPDVHVISTALARQTGYRNLHLTKHRGYCSFLEPDNESEWFKESRPGEGEVESVVRVQTQSLDDFATSNGLAVDFLKIDTEGTELEVIEGGQVQVDEHVLGIRASMYFLRCYKEQPLFGDMADYLMPKRYFLLNLDYFGRGVPRVNLFRNPDPLSLDQSRYGTLIGTDGVWLREYSWVRDRFARDTAGLAYATLKYAYFCMLNFAPDVAVDTLLKFVQAGNTFGEAAKASLLYRTLRRRCAEFLGRWRVYPDAQWEFARSVFEQVFGFELHGGNKYWELVQTL